MTPFEAATDYYGEEPRYLVAVYDANQVHVADHYLLEYQDTYTVKHPRGGHLTVAKLRRSRPFELAPPATS